MWLHSELMVSEPRTSCRYAALTRTRRVSTVGRPALARDVRPLVCLASGSTRTVVGRGQAGLTSRTSHRSGGQQQQQQRPAGARFLTELSPSSPQPHFATTHHNTTITRPATHVQPPDMTDATTNVLVASDSVQQTVR